MGSMKGKQEKIDAAFGRIADMIPSGNLLAGTDPVGFLDIVAAELKDLRSECEMLRNIINTLNGDNGERLTDKLPEVAELVEALEELVDLMEDTYQGEYIPDSLTTQPARAALAAYRTRECK